MKVQGPAGLNYFTRSDLAYATIVKVTRDRVVHLKVSTTPGDRQFRHDSSSGKIEFSEDNPFNFAVLNPDGSRMIEYVYVIYRRGTEVVVEPEGPSENP